MTDADANDTDEKNPEQDAEALERALEKLCITKCTKMSMTNHKTSYNALRLIAGGVTKKNIKKTCFYSFFINFSIYLCTTNSVGATGDGGPPPTRAD